MEWTAGLRGEPPCQKWGAEEGGSGFKRKGAGSWRLGAWEAQVSQHSAARPPLRRRLALL